MCLVILNVTAQHSKEELDEISNTHSIKNLPSDYFGVLNKDGYLLNNPESVIALSLTGTYKSDGYVEIPGFLGIQNTNGIWNSELYRCKDLCFFEYSVTKVMSPDLDFSRFPELREVYLSYIFPKQLNQLFHKNSKLRCLNAPTFVGYPVEFCELKHLEFLEVDAERLRKLPEDCLKNMQSLKYIKIYSPTEEEVKKIFCIPSLEVLEVVNGKSIQIPESVSEMKHLKQLSFQNVEEVIVSNGLYDLDSLEILSFDGGYVEFPEEHEGFSALKVIRIDGSSVNTFPRFGKNNNLKVLDYFFTGSYKDYSFDFSNLTQLERCRIESTDMMRNIGDDGILFPIGIENLSNLQELHLVVKSTEEIPEDFARLENLRILNLNYTITPKDIKFLSQLKQLEYIGFDLMRYPKMRKKVVKKMKNYDLKPITIELSDFQLDYFDYYPKLIRYREKTAYKL